MSGLVSITAAVPQSHTSSPSLSPFPHEGSPTMFVGSFVKQRPRLLLDRVNALFTALTLQELHCSGPGKIEIAAITHRPSGSLQLQPPEKGIVN